MTSQDETIDWDDAGGRPAGPAEPPDGSASELVRLLDRYLADLQAGRAPDRDRLLADHPELASRLESCLAGIDFIHRAAGPMGGEEGHAQLGEFRIVREIGRGGMGVVYEAEQTTLRRTVALKVLPFGVAAGEGAMPRFLREAETVAQLHHTNIVPIFAVGGERGVQYYAMQLIDGRNLAEVLAEARDRDRLPSPEDVARWGLQAAEALDYAHRRHVIHRDVKPSNLLLDPEGIVWLTDFGLAKRADEVTLTVAGTLMGTPRYMSPEQAEALSRPVDHRTDIYSLGATLYELATGRPVFEAATPHGVIQRILVDEPIPPRQVRPGLSRDLETVILTCLAKDPGRRYDSAKALADDLRAVLDGRPIQARRVGPVGRAIRWVRRQRRLVGVATAAAFAAVLLVSGIAGGWTIYSRAQLATLRLSTASPHLAAEILDESGDRILVPGVSLPTRQPLELQAGDHRVRLSAPGQLSETYALRLRRGESRSFDVGLDDGHLWDPLPINSIGPTLHFLETEGRTDLVEHKHDTMRRIDGATGRTLWTLDAPPQGQAPGGTPSAAPGPEDERRRAFEMIRGSGFDLADLARPSPDLDGDGVGDLVWAGRNAPGLWAVSGRGDDQGRGRELWLFRAEGGGAVVGLPAVADVDSDGTPDLIATFQANARTWVQAVSGRSGTSLWSFDVPARLAHTMTQHGSPEAFAARIGRFGDAKRVIVVVGTGVLSLDPATGTPEWEGELGGAAARAPILEDLDGDGNPDVLLVAEGTQGQRVVALSPGTRRRLWSRPTTVAWRRGPTPEPDRAPDWPLAADLDGDGAAEVVVPVSSPVAAPLWAGLEVLRGRDGEPLWQRKLRTPVLSAEVHRFLAGPDLDGDGYREVFVASNADERGRTDRIEAALYVDALSGRDGRTFWWWRRPTSDRNDEVGPLRWWGDGPDGWPRLVVTHTIFLDRPGATFLISAGTGKLDQELPGAFGPHPADFDGDGTLDLGFRTSPANSIGVGISTFHALRGRPPAPWGRLGRLEPAADLDGDGLDDLIEPREDGMTAYSGRDGRRLWDSDLPPRLGSILGPWELVPDTALEASGDLDGDGTPDLLAGMTGGVGFEGNAVMGFGGDDRSGVPILLRAISGRAGRLLWTAEEVPAPAGRGAIFARPRSARCVDLDGDGTPEIAAVIHVDGPFGRGPALDQLWLMVLSGPDGRLRWKQLLAEQGSNHTAESLQRFAPAPRFASLDGEPDRDIVLAVPVPTDAGRIRVELRTFGGRDGRPIWTHELPPRTTAAALAYASLPELALGDLDGRDGPELVVVDRAPAPPDGPIAQGPGEFRLIRLDGRTGRPIGEPWTFRDDSRPDGGPPRPVLADLEGEGRDLISLWVHDDRGHRIVRIDGRDDALRTRATPAVPPMPVSPSLRACDLDGKAGAELVGVRVRDGATVEVFAGDPEHPLWARAFEGMARIVEVMPGRPGRPAWVAVGTLRNTLVGLDGATGRTLWRGQGRASDHGPTLGDIPIFDSPLLHDAGPDATPRVVSRSNSSTLGLLTLRATPSGITPSPDRAPAVVRPDESDPRLVRPLPWTGLTREALALGLVESVAMAVVLVVTPALALYGLLCRRPRRLGPLLLVPAILGSALAAARAWKPDLPASLLVLQIAAGLPIAILGWLVSLWFFRRRWRRLGLLVVLLVAVAATLAAILLHNGLRLMAPWQRYAWADWYWILAPASYVVGLMMTVGLLLAPLGRLARRGWRGLRMSGPS